METLAIIISVLATLLGLSVTFIIWIATRNKKLKDEQENKLISTTTKLTDSQVKLDKSILQLTTTVNANLEICHYRHKILDDTVHCNSQEIEECKDKIHDIQLRLAQTNK